MPRTGREFARQGAYVRNTASALSFVAGAGSPPSGMVRRVIIDSDTATDDAVAILLAVQCPGVKVEAITITAGNVGFEQMAKNALYTLEISGHGGEVPVFLGSRRPLFREKHETVTRVHGTDGMSDAFFPDPRQQPEREHAVEAILRLANDSPGELTILAIGPLTNIGLALLRDPSLAKKIAAVYFMGGAYMFYGNITPVATYNVWVDPEAARIVFQSGIPITTVGFDVSCKSSVVTDEEYESVEAFNTKLSAFFVKINRIRRQFCKEKQRLRGSNHPDALTMAVFIDPSIGTRMVHRFVDVETQGELTRGVMAIDELGVWGKAPNANVCAEADEKKFKEMLFSVLKTV